MSLFVLLGVSVGSLFLACLCWTLLRAPRIVITVSRPTTQDGENVQLSATAGRRTSSRKLAAIVERLSLSIQYRQKAWNDYVARETLEIEHGKWQRIKAKLDQESKLSNEERRWWQAHAGDFDERGIIHREKVLTAVGDGDGNQDRP